MQTSSTGVSRTRQVVAAVIGNALEWYDFIVYGFLASIIARQFFPSDDEYASLLMALATFGDGFFNDWRRLARHFLRWGRFLDVGGMAVEFGIFQRARAGVIED